MIGKDFWANAAAALAGEGGLEEVEALVRKRLIEPVRRAGVPRDFFQFRHILVRDAVYGSLSRRAGRRSTSASPTGSWVGRSRIGQIEEIVGYHLETAHRCRRELLGSQERVEELAHRAAAHLSNAAAEAAARQDDAAAAALLARWRCAGEWQLGPVGASGATGRARHRPGAGREAERANQVLAEARQAVVASGDERAEARMRVLEANLKLTDPVVDQPRAHRGRAGARGVPPALR